MTSIPMMPLALVITADLISGWGWPSNKLAMVKTWCSLAARGMLLIWPLLKVMVSVFAAEVVFTRHIPVHHWASEAMCGM